VRSPISLQNRERADSTSCCFPSIPCYVDILYPSPRAFQVRTHTHTHTHHYPASGRDTSPILPEFPAPCSWRLPTHPGSTWAQPGARLPLGPRSPWPAASREGGRGPGSDGQRGRPIEPGIASPKGGSGGSHGPNERGARVGLPPGIPLARIAGPWVTRKLGGRWRRPRLEQPGQ
jgi:hypothetical protein